LCGERRGVRWSGDGVVVVISTTAEPPGRIAGERSANGGLRRWWLWTVPVLALVTTDPYSENCRNPRVRGKAAEYTDEELAEMAAQHAGDGYDDSGNARPGSNEVLDAMENGMVRRNTGRDGTQQPATKGARVRINDRDPTRSTCWYD